MRLDHYYDAIYLSLNIAMLASLTLAIVLGVFAHRTAGPLRPVGASAAMMAGGTALALAGGLVADAALGSSPWFQQVRFGAYYLGFSAIVLGTAVALRGVPGTPRRSLVVRPLVIAVLLAYIIGIVFVTVPSTFVRNARGDQVQLAVYWLPLLVASAGSCVALLVERRHIPQPVRSRLMCIAAFAGLLFVGLLRESEILPDLGEPLTNLLVAFLPFVAGAVLLAVAARPLHAGPREKTLRPGV